MAWSCTLLGLIPISKILHVRLDWTVVRSTQNLNGSRSSFVPAPTSTLPVEFSNSSHGSQQQVHFDTLPWSKQLCSPSPRVLEFGKNSWANLRNRLTKRKTETTFSALLATHLYTCFLKRLPFVHLLICLLYTLLFSPCMTSSPNCRKVSQISWLCSRTCPNVTKRTSQVVFCIETLLLHNNLLVARCEQMLLLKVRFSYPSVPVSKLAST